MPIDTREKRASVTGNFLYGPGVTNNVDKDNEWRKEAGYSYPLVPATSTYLATTKRTMTGAGA